MIDTNEKRPYGGLDMDSSLKDVKDEDYIDARNLTNFEKDDVNEVTQIKLQKGISDSFATLDQTNANVGPQYDIWLPDNFDFSTTGNWFSIQLKTKNGIDIPNSFFPFNATGPYVDIFALVNDINLYFSSTFFTSNGLFATASANFYGQGINGITIEISAPIFDWDIEVTPLAPNNVVTDVVRRRDYYPLLTYTKRGGFSKIIGSARFDDGAFVFWTPAKFKPQIASVGVSYQVSNVVNVAASSNIEILNIGGPHQLVDGDIVNLSGWLPSYYNGLWTISVISDTEFCLVGSIFETFVAPTQIGSISTSPVPFGAISVVYDEQWTTSNSVYLNLINAQGFNFCHEQQIDAVAKKQGDNYIIKWTDNYNLPKMLIYRGEFLTQGFLYRYDTQTINNYRLETISESSKWLIGTLNVPVTCQPNDGGGSLDSANYSYMVRGVFEDGTYTGMTMPTNPVSVFKAQYSTGLGNEFQGSAYNDSTTKSNTIVVSDIPKGVYKSFELIAIKYSNGSFSASIANRSDIALNADTIAIDHIGGEVEIPVSSAELQQIYLVITRALNVAEADNRGILSNVTVGIDLDLTNWAQNIEYGIFRHSIDPTGYVNIPSTLPIAEYANPNTIINHTSYMLFETVRWGIRVKWKNGNWSQVYHVVDADVNDDPVGGRRYATLPNLNLNSNTETWAFYFRFRNVDYDFIIDGRPIRELIEDIEFVRCDVVKEILATGAALLSSLQSAVPSGYRLESRSADTTTAFSAGLSRERIYFFSPDLSAINSDVLEWETGDEFISFGQMNNSQITSVATGDLIEFDMSSGITSSIAETGTIFAAGKMVNGGTNTPFVIGSNSFYLQDIANTQYRIQMAYGIQVSAALTPISGADYGIYYFFYKRPVANKYPVDVSQSIYKSIGFSGADILLDTTSTEYSCYGGDCFVQRCYLPIRDDETGSPTLSMRHSYISINRTNWQLTQGRFPGLTPSFTGTLQARIDAFVGSSAGGYFNTQYSKTYNRKNLINYYAAYNSFFTDEEYRPTQVYWSEQTLSGSMFNNDRYFLPANFRDLGLIFGPIMGMSVVNDNLITLQPDKTERQYFDNTGYLINSDDNSAALLGTGEIMGRKGEFNSGYGLSNKWAYFKGTSDGGKEVLYYVDTKRKKILRWGGDGSVVISERGNINNFLFNALSLAQYYDTPCKDYGIHGWWDEKNKWAIFCVRVAQIRTMDGPIENWTNGNSYTEGQYVIDLYVLSNYDGMPVTFLCNQSHTATINDRPALWGSSGASEAYWTPIYPSYASDVINTSTASVNTKFYNYFTLVWSEIENKFKWFQSLSPDIAVSYRNTFITQAYWRFVEVLELNYTPSLNPMAGGLYVHDESGERGEFFNSSQFTYNINLTITYNGTNIITVPSGLLYQYMVTTNGLNGNPIKGNIQWYFIGQDGINYEIVAIGASSFELAIPYPFTGTASSFDVSFNMVVDGYISPVANKNGWNNVKFSSIAYDTLIAPHSVEVKTDATQTFITSANFEKKQNYWFSPVLGDTTNGALPEDGDGIVWGKYAKLKMIFASKVNQFLHSFVVKTRTLTRFIQK